MFQKSLKTFFALFPVHYKNTFHKKINWQLSVLIVGPCKQMEMKISPKQIILVGVISILGGVHVISSESIKLIGPKCGDFFDGEKNDAKCGTTVTPEPSENLSLGVLCENNDRLKLRIVREDADVEGKLCFNILIFRYFSYIKLIL